VETSKKYMGKDNNNRDNDPWYVYIVRCSDGTLYTGIAKDLEKRLEAHNSGNKGARYTRSRRPVTLVYAQQVESQSAASGLEYRLKKLTKAKKEELAGRGKS
jgi:putative endonuclease